MPNAHQLIKQNKARAALVLALTGVCSALSGCASASVAIGEWSRPADLALNTESLKGVRMSVNCGTLNERQEFVGMENAFCGHLREAMARIGASVIELSDGAETSASPADLTLTYIDKGPGPRMNSGFADLAFSLTQGLFTLISVESSSAEVQIKDPRGAVLERAPLRIETVKAYGISALIQYFADPGGPSRRAQALSQTFYDYAQNRVYSRYVASQRPIVAGARPAQ